MVRWICAGAVVGSIAATPIAGAAPVRDPFTNRTGAPESVGSPAEPPPAPLLAAAPRSTATAKSPRSVIVLGLGGAALIAASVTTGLYTKLDQNDAKSQLGSPYDVGNFESRVHRDYVLARYVGTGLFVAGAASLAVAAYLYLGRREDRTIIAPAMSPDHIGLALSGGF